MRDKHLKPDRHYFSSRLPRRLIRRLKARAALENKTVEELLEEAVEGHVIPVPGEREEED